MNTKDLPLPEQKFFKTVIRIEVLSPDRPVGDFSLTALDQAITYNDCSGIVEVESEEEITPKQMAAECQKQNTDPTFFDIDENGDRTDFWHTND